MKINLLFMEQVSRDWENEQNGNLEYHHRKEDFMS